MIRLNELAAVANHIYKPNSPHMGAVLINKLMTTDLSSIGNMTAWALITDVDPMIIPLNNFYAGLYIHFDNAKATNAVIVYRGTKPLNISNDCTDIKTWFSDVFGDGSYDKLPSYYVYASSFFYAARDYLDKHFPDVPLKVTGHSLGGALAQLIVAYSHMPVKSIVFNSPGIGNIPDVNLEAGYQVLNINSTYGFINKVGKVIGEILYIDVPNKESYAKDAFEKHDLILKDEKQIRATKNPLIMIADEIEIKGASRVQQNDFLLSCAAQHSMGNLLEAINHHPDFANKLIL